MTDSEALRLEKKLELREEALKCLLTKYGYQNDNKSLYQCAEDWVSKGNITTFGIVKYYEAYYA